MPKNVPYESLTEKQRAQVAYLFADAHFGASVNAFCYELDKAGDVVGRTMDNRPQTIKPKGGRRSAKVNVKIVEVNITDEMRSKIEMNREALAALIARKMHVSNINQEVKHESN